MFGKCHTQSIDKNLSEHASQSKYKIIPVFISFYTIFKKINYMAQVNWRISNHGTPK